MELWPNLGRASKTYQRYRDAGGDLDIGVVGIDEPVATPEDHKRALLLLARNAPWAGVYGTAWIKEELMVSEAISPEAMIDHLPTWEPGEVPHPSWERYLSLRECIRISPYLTTEESVVESWSQVILNELFVGVDDDLQVRRWSTDWDGYFVDGLYMLGAACWTVHRPGYQWITILRSSSID